MICEALRAARLSDLSPNLLEREVGQQVDQDLSMTAQADGPANRGGCRVDQAALDAGPGDHAFATAIEVAEAQADRLQRLARKPAFEDLAPAVCDIKTAVGRLECFDVCANVPQGLDPAAVRAQLRPTRAPEREDRRARADQERTGGRFELQRMTLRLLSPARPAVTHVEAHALGAQP